MKQNKTPLVVPVLWFIATATWIIALCVDFYYGVTPYGLVVMHILCVLTSLIAAIANLIRYKKAKNQNTAE